MNKHTPGEWVAKHGVIFCPSDRRGVRSAKKIRICTMSFAWMGSEEALANAERIMRAVNCHDELLAALKFALVAFCDPAALDRDSAARNFKAMADAAIAKAEGQ